MQGWKYISVRVMYQQHSRTEKQWLPSFHTSDGQALENWKLVEQKVPKGIKDE